jgi:hypothetical protein
MIKKFPSFYGIRRPFTVCTGARATCPYPSAGRVQATPFHPMSLRSILILSSHLRLGPPSGLLPSGSLTKILYAFLIMSRDSSVGIALGYGLDDRAFRVRFPAGAGSFSLHHRVHNSSEAHPASYPVGTRGSFPAGKAADT